MPSDSLINFPRRGSASTRLHGQQSQQSEEQQTITQNQNHSGLSAVHAPGMQLPSVSGGVRVVNNSLNISSPTSMSATTIVGLLHQNSNSRQENPMGSANSPFGNTANNPYVGGNTMNSPTGNTSNSHYGGANTANILYGCGSTVQIPSASSSNSIPPSQLNPSSPFPSPTPSTSNNNTTPTSHGNTHLNSASSPANTTTVQQQATHLNSARSPANMTTMQQQTIHLNSANSTANMTTMQQQTTHLNSTNSPASMSTMQQQTMQPHETDPTDSQSSVQQILQELMMSSQFNGVNMLGNEMKGISVITPALDGGNSMVGNGIGNNSGVTGMGFGSLSVMGSSPANRLSAAMSNNSANVNGRVGMNHTPQDPLATNHHQHQDMGNRLLGGPGSANSFSNLQFDWKSSP